MKYVHQHDQQLTNDKKVKGYIARILKGFTSLRENERVWACVSDDDSKELREIEERIKEIHTKYEH